MKVVSVLLAQSARVLRASGSFGYLPDVAKAIGERYGFVEVPTGSQLLPSSTDQPITFRHGRLTHKGKKIVIGRLDIYQVGVSAVTLTSTADADLFLDELLDWASSHFKVTFELIAPAPVYLSQLEFSLGRSLADYLPALKPIGAEISERLSGFWQARPAYEVTAISFSVDSTKLPTPMPGLVRIERRVGSSFDKNLYFSEAPLATVDHITLLEHFERILAK